MALTLSRSLGASSVAALQPSPSQVLLRSLECGTWPCSAFREFRSGTGNRNGRERHPENIWNVIRRCREHGDGSKKIQDQFVDIGRILVVLPLRGAVTAAARGKGAAAARGVRWEARRGSGKGKGRMVRVRCDAAITEKPIGEEEAADEQFEY
uniref:Uncharacterized protein n=1 Tax=Oryza brachyantha TaxID=4533 RepID=J3MS06_ORYBR